MSPILTAALWMSGAIASFSAMAVAGRAVSFELETFEIMMYRSFIGLAIMISLITVTGKWAKISPKNMPLHIMRNSVHFAGQNLWFFAITVIPLAQVFALEFTSPLWVLVLSPFILGERLTSIRVLAAVLGFIGILIVTRPNPDSLNIGIFAAALSAVFFAMTTMFTKRLTRSQPTVCILFWLTLIQVVLGVIFSAHDGDIALPSIATAPWLVLIGLAGLLAHFCITSALAIAPATVVVPIDFIRLPAIAVVGMLFYNEPLDGWVLIGALVIFGGNYLNIWSETRKPRSI